MSPSEQFLIEAFKSAREELMMRVSHRDRILKQTVIVFGLIFVALFNVTNNYKLNNIDNFLLFFIHVISFIFYCLYQKEDYLIGQLSKYIKIDINGRLGFKEILLWDSTDYFKGHDDKSMKYRLYVTIGVFIALPISISLLYIYHNFSKLALFLKFTNFNYDFIIFIIFNLIKIIFSPTLFILIVILLHVYIFIDMFKCYKTRKNICDITGIYCINCKSIIANSRCHMCSMPLNKNFGD